MLRNFTPRHLFTKSAIVAYVCALTLHSASGGVNNTFRPNLCGFNDRLVQCSSAADSYPVKRTVVQRCPFVHPREATPFSPHECAVNEHTPFAKITGCNDGTILKQTTIAERAVFERFTLMNFTICQFISPNP